MTGYTLHMIGMSGCGWCKKSKKHFDGYDIAFHMDGKGSAFTKAHKLDGGGVPHWVVLGPDGVVLAETRGFQDNAALLRALVHDCGKRNPNFPSLEAVQNDLSAILRTEGFRMPRRRGQVKGRARNAPRRKQVKERYIPCAMGRKRRMQTCGPWPQNTNF